MPREKLQKWMVDLSTFNLNPNELLAINKKNLQRFEDEKRTTFIARGTPRCGRTIGIVLPHYCVYGGVSCLFALLSDLLKLKNFCSNFLLTSLHMIES